MRPILVITGVLLVMFSIPSYYYSPQYLTNTAHSFISSMSGGNMNSASMLRQMGYPSLHQVIPMVQYMIVGLAVAGAGIAMFGVVAKKVSKSISVKLVADDEIGELYLSKQSRGSSTHNSQSTAKNDAMFQATNDVLSKLETELKEMKTGYQDHRHTIENEKRKLEQKKREKLAKVIVAGEIITKEISRDKFDERVRYYVEMTNKETGQLIDLSLLAEKFAKMKQTISSMEENINPTDLENVKKLLDQ